VLLERRAEEESIGAESPEHARDEDELIDAGAEGKALGEAGGRRHGRIAPAEPEARLKSRRGPVVPWRG
jgi:hypothetical protein